MVQKQTFGILTTKLGYEAKMEDSLSRERGLVVEISLEARQPLENKNISLIVIINKVLTWDNGQKRIWNGPSWCVLCKKDCESVDHKFCSCPFKNQFQSGTLGGVVVTNYPH